MSGRIRCSAGPWVELPFLRPWYPNTSGSTPASRTLVFTNARIYNNLNLVKMFKVWDIIIKRIYHWGCLLLDVLKMHIKHFSIINQQVCYSRHNNIFLIKIKLIWFNRYRPPNMYIYNQFIFKLKKKKKN